ncbi:MAG TPA: carboxylating nicotinate-nucleotide diphosphorylase [Candidatus Nanoarchaeia archaeon]|nr:carboxylating nicotinate-nucleotide diphosphorylase [Candidatus Nanoarchaeia archaeon]
MDRRKILERSFQRGHLLTVKSKFYRDWIDTFIIDEIKADFGKGDITSEAVLMNKKAKATVFSRSAGVIAGIEEVCYILRSYGLDVRELVKDGEKIRKGSKILEISGKANSILKLERTALDMLSRMSGIASLTNQLVKKAGKVGIAPTRKTEWRFIDKKAVFVGGGLTHRLALWESILIKDNHLDALKKEGVHDPVVVSIERAWKNRKRGAFIEIEASNEADAFKAAQKFKELQGNSYNTPCFIMLDNMKPAAIKKIIRRLKALNNHVMIEASGGITPDNLKAYSKTGVDVISMGYLTTSCKALDMKLRFI